MNCSFCKSENPLWIEKTKEGNLFCNLSCQHQFYKIGVNTEILPKDVVILQLSYLKFKDLLKVYNTGNKELRNIIKYDKNFRYRWIQKFSLPLNEQDKIDARKVIKIIWKNDIKELFSKFGIKGIYRMLVYFNNSEYSFSCSFSYIYDDFSGTFLDPLKFAISLRLNFKIDLSKVKMRIRFDKFKFDKEVDDLNISINDYIEEFIGIQEELKLVMQNDDDMIKLYIEYE